MSTLKVESSEKLVNALLITHLPTAGRDFKDDYRDFWTFSEISVGTVDRRQKVEGKKHAKDEEGK